MFEPIPAEESLLTDVKLGKLSAHCQNLTSIISKSSILKDKKNGQTFEPFLQ